MILPDVNILVHAFRSDASDHQLCRGWLQKVIDSGTRFGVSPLALSGTVRITTHPKVFARPSPLTEAMSFCEALLARENCAVVRPGPTHWSLFVRLCRDSDARGNLVPDAWFAALAIESGCEWISLDRDYSRFPDLHWSLPTLS